MNVGQQIAGNGMMRALETNFYAFVVWVLLCVAVAILAKRYNRNEIGFFVCSFFLSPLVGAAFVLALGHFRPKP